MNLSREERSVLFGSLFRDLQLGSWMVIGVARTLRVFAEQDELPVDPVTTSPPRRRDGGLVRESEPIYGLHDTSALIHQ